MGERDNHIATCISLSPGGTTPSSSWEAAALTEMAPAVDPHPGRMPEQDLLNPQNLSAMAAELCIVFGKILWGLEFFRLG